MYTCTPASVGLRPIMTLVKFENLGSIAAGAKVAEELHSTGCRFIFYHPPSFFFFYLLIFIHLFIYVVQEARNERMSSFSEPLKKSVKTPLSLRRY